MGRQVQFAEYDGEEQREDELEEVKEVVVQLDIRGNSIQITLGQDSDLQEILSQVQAQNELTDEEIQSVAEQIESIYNEQFGE